MQTTLIILKPDAVQRGLMGRIISRLEDKGLTIIGARMMKISRDLAARHYEVHKGKPFYDGLVNFMTSSPVMVLAVYGKRAIETCRKLMGKTVGYEADPGTIRGDFGSSRSFNLVHGSDGEESAAKELALFFRDDELIEYERVIDRWVVDARGGEPE